MTAPVRSPIKHKVEKAVMTGSSWNLVEKCHPGSIWELIVKIWGTSCFSTEEIVVQVG